MMKKPEVIAQLKDLIRDRESFLDGMDDDIFYQDIAALKGAIELIENSESPEEQIWIHRKSGGEIDKIDRVVDDGLGEHVWFEEVNSVKGTCYRSVFLDDSAWNLASASELMSVFWVMFRRLNNILVEYRKLKRSLAPYTSTEEALKAVSLEGSQWSLSEVLFTDGSDKTIKDGYDWEIDGDFMRFFDVGGRTVAMFKTEDVRGVLYTER